MSCLSRARHRAQTIFDKRFVNINDAQGMDCVDEGLVDRKGALFLIQSDTSVLGIPVEFCL